MTAQAIDIKALIRHLTDSHPFSLLDVRRRSDYEAMPKIIPGALWRDPEKIDQWISELPTGIPTVVYCVKGGSVSRSVADRLRRAGLVALFLEGGLKAWTDNGQTIEETQPG